MRFGVLIRCVPPLSNLNKGGKKMYDYQIKQHAEEWHVQDFLH